MDPTTLMESAKRPCVANIATVPQTLFFLDGQIGYLKKSGFDSCAISSPGRLLTKFGKMQQIATYALDMERRVTPLKDIRSIFELWRLLRRLQPHIVDAHTPKGGLIGMLGAWLAGVPVRVYHLHGLPMLTAVGYRYWILYLSEKVCCLLADRVICVSDSIRQIIVEKGLCPVEKSIVLHHGSINGVDAIDRFNPKRISAQERLSIRERYGIPMNAEVLGFVGRLVPDKGIGDLVKAWQTLKEIYPRLHLLLVGRRESNTPLTDDLEGVLQKDKRIHLTGHVDDVNSLYAIMDVFVFPSHREGFGVSIIEASAMGIPVVVSRIPGCVNAAIDNVTGVLIPPRDPSALVETIMIYLNEPDLRDRHGRAGREWVLRYFNPVDIWEATATEYTHLLAAKQLPLPQVSR